MPFQYSDYLRRHIGVGAFLRASDGVMVEDLDGNLLFDLTGSYWYAASIAKAMHPRCRVCGQGSARPERAVRRPKRTPWRDRTDGPGAAVTKARPRARSARPRYACITVR